MEYKTAWTKEDIDMAIYRIQEAKDIIEQYKIFDPKAPNFVTSTSRLSGAIREADKWAKIIKSQCIGRI